MLSTAFQDVHPEIDFARSVDALASGPAAERDLLGLLQEDRPEYSQKSSSAIVRMRGWILLALSRIRISDAALPFILEELQSGTDPYLIAAAARALRTYPHPSPALTPVVLHALRHAPDGSLSFAGYGRYELEGNGITATSELLASLEWLGASAASALPELTLMKQTKTISKRLRTQLKQTIDTIRGAGPFSNDVRQNCCDFANSLGWRFTPLQVQAVSAAVESVPFQDQDGNEILYGEFFSEIPSVVVFFYTRCDNPWKCSLTITKLARLQHLLRERGLSEQVKTAAITYDPDSDLSRRLRAYGQERGMKFTANDRMLRTTRDFETVRSHFELGVGFAGPLVNRHQIELYLLNRNGRIAARFSRLQWNETEVVNSVSKVLEEKGNQAPIARSGFAFLTALISLAWAFFPKCPMCWASYASALGILGLVDLRYPSYLGYILPFVFFLNLATLWVRARASKKPAMFWLAGLGAMLIVLGRSSWVASGIPIVRCGSALSVLASLWSAFLVKGGSSDPRVPISCEAGRQSSNNLHS